MSLEHLVEVLGIADNVTNSGNIPDAEADNENFSEENEGDDSVIAAAEEEAEEDQSADNSDAQEDAADNDHSIYEEAINLNNEAVSDKTREFVANVKSVKFSNPELVWVGRIDEMTTVREIKTGNNLDCEYSSDLTEEQIEEINAQTVKAGDWALISVKPFLSEETLTVTMKNEEVFTIKVRDGQLITYVLSDGGEIYKVTVTFDKYAEIPEDARLVTRLYSEDETEFLEAKESVERIKNETLSGTISMVEDQETVAEASSEASDGAFSSDALTDQHLPTNSFSMLALDISIYDSKGNIVEPKSAVSVSIELLSFPEDTDAELLGRSMEVHHIIQNDGKQTAVLVADVGKSSEGTVLVEEDKAFAKFTTDSFSVYTISWGSSNNQSVRLHFVNEDGTELSGVTYNGSNVDGSSITISPTDTGIIQFDSVTGELDLSQFTVSGKTLSSTHRGTPKDILPGVPKPDTNNTNDRRNQQPHSIIGNKLKWNGTNIQYQYFYTNDDKAGSVWMDAGYRPQTSDTNENHTMIPDDTPVFDGNINYDGTYTTYDYFLVYSPDYVDNGNSASQHGETPEIGEVGKDKQLTPNGDGIYTLDLSVTTEAKKDEKYNDLNIILVLDTSSSMRRDENDKRPSDGAAYDPTTRRMILTANAIEQFVNDLKTNNTTENPDAVEMALITFNEYATPVMSFTNNLDSIVTTVWNLNGGREHTGTNDSLAQGTNWADGLRLAKEMEITDSDPTFVLFLTDGAPSEYWKDESKPGGGLLFVDGEGCYLGAREEGRTLASTGRDFYGVFSFGTSVDEDNDYLGDLLDYSYEKEVRSKKRFYANNGTELLAYLRQILAVIYETIGHAGVNYHDGIALDTASTALKTNGVNGNLGGITYSKSGGTSPGYTVVTNSDGTIQSFKVDGTEYKSNASIRATKAWVNDSNTPPEGASVTLTLYKGESTETATTAVSAIVLNGTADYSGTEHVEGEPENSNAYENIAWHALWKDLPMYDSTGEDICYVVKETGTYEGYTVSYEKTTGDEPEDKDYALDKETITNSKLKFRFDILKVKEETTEPLPGASFTIRKVKETSNTSRPEYEGDSTASDPVDQTIFFVDFSAEFALQVAF